MKQSLSRRKPTTLGEIIAVMTPFDKAVYEEGDKKSISRGSLTNKADYFLVCVEQCISVFPRLGLRQFSF